MDAIDAWSLIDIPWASLEGGIDAYLQCMIDRCTALFGASRASLFACAEGSQTFQLAAQSGGTKPLPGDAAIVRGIGIAGAAIANRRPLIMEERQPPTANLELDPFGEAEAITSSMIVPLDTGVGDIVGVLNVARGPGRSPFRENDLRLAMSLAAHIALAVNNATLIGRMDFAKRDAEMSYERLRKVLDHLGIGMVLVSREGIITHRNAQASLMLGMQEAVGSTFEEGLSNCSRILIEPAKSVLDAANRGEIKRISVGDRSNDRWWLLVGSPQPDGGVTIAIEDVSAFERSRHELERMTRLAEIGQMTAAIAHEIRNPLTGIISAAQMIVSSPDLSFEFGQMIEVEAKKLNALCDEFLEFARPVTLKLEPSYLASVIGRVIDQFCMHLPQSQVQVELKIEGAQPIIQLDTAKIEQVMRNLLRNAIQASEQGGKVLVTVRGNSATIKDGGHGMSAETLSNLFVPFFTTKANGTGLGMCVVKKAIQAHGGDITVRSELGKGTSVTLNFEGEN